MTIIIKNLPNAITLVRLILSCLLNIYIIKNFGDIWVPAIITLIIFFTDYADGKIARYYGSSTRFGAIFDVMADLFYILVSYFTLSFCRILPIWFIFIILFKFIEFVITSYFIKKKKHIKTSFVFDYLGRFVAVLFYIIPLLAYISYHKSQSIYFFIINKLFYVILVLVLASTLNRLWGFIKVTKLPLGQKHTYSVRNNNLHKTLIKILTLQK